jgi:hypothetical protein
MSKLEERIKKHEKDTLDTISYLRDLQERIDKGVTADDYYGYEPFYKFANFFMNEEYNSYGEVAGWGGFCTNLSSLENFLHCAHHAFIDDGDISWVNSRVHGPIIVMGDYREWEYDNTLDKFVGESHYDDNVGDNTYHSMYSLEHVDEWLEARITHEEEHKATMVRIEELKKRVRARLTAEVDNEPSE